MMKETTRRRAFKDEHKQERRQDILEAAWKIFQTAPYEEVTIANVAVQTHLAKGTVFLYFKTKEELFLALLEQQLAEWFDALDADLSALGSRTTADQVAAAVADSLKPRDALTRLLAILATAFERNVELASALRFKHMLLARLTHTGALLEHCLPFLTQGQGARLLLHLQALVVGLKHLADPSPVMRQVLEQPDMRAFDLDFDQEFQPLLTTFLRGVEASARPNAAPMWKGRA